jgi:glycosyltransferase involved in cell wall biosynthesis
MTRILWHGVAPWEGTGYGTQAATWTRYLAAQGHDVAVSACHGLQGMPLKWEGIMVYPAPVGGRGDMLLRTYARAHKAEVVIILYDLWPMSPEAVPRDIPVLAWVASDAHRLGKGDASFLAETGAIPVAISDHTKRTLAEAGWPDARVVPHGIDLDVFRPPESREAVRFAYDLADDVFAIGINSSNVDRMRKGIPEQMEAFARFHGKHPSSRLFLHTIADMRGDGSNHLGEVAEDYGILDYVSWCDQANHLAGGYSPQDMASWYAAMDVVSNCSMGEGFGLAAVEAQACGTPVILSDGTTGPQLAGPGWLVATQRHWNPVHSARWHMPLVDSITAAYERAWRARHDGPRRARCVQHAARYGTQVVGPLWDEAIAAAVAL